MAGRQVTIFGGSGFIGRYVVERLADKGWTIRVAVRSPRRANFLKPLGDVGQIVPLRAPLQDEEAVRAACEGSEAVINLVGILYETGKQTFGEVQALGAERAAKAAAAAGAKRFVQISAIGADANSAAVYGRSKAYGEKAVREAFPEATILRPSIVFGPEDDFFNRFAAMARIAPALPLIGGGGTRFQPVYVADVADAVVADLESSSAKGETYELGGPRTYSFKELMELLLETIGRRRYLCNLPFSLARLQGAILEKFPGPPLLTRDQVLLLERDNVVAEGAKTLADLGIEATACEAIIPAYLQRFKRGGGFSTAEV
jgi:NADH dehydrogenase